MIGERDLDFIIDSVQYDYLENNDDVQGNWKITRDLGTPSLIYVFYQPYEDGSQDTYYPPKATRYRLMLLDEIEGDDAENMYEKWQERR